MLTGRLGQERSKRFLDKSSLELLRREVDSVLIEAHREVLQVECGVYLDRATVAAGSSTEPADVSDVRRMLRFFLFVSFAL